MLPMNELQAISNSNGWRIKEEGNRIKMYNWDNTVFIMILIDGSNYSLSVEVQSDLTNMVVIEPSRYLNEKQLPHYVDTKQKQYANYSSETMIANS
jgi:hypothetical protein